MQTLFGRRKGDQQIVSNVMQEVMMRLSEGWKKPGGHIRRPRRTKKQLREALERAKKMLLAQNPTWLPEHIVRRAKSLVRRYQV